MGRPRSTDGAAVPSLGPRLTGAAIIVLAIAMVFAPTRDFDFVNYDDFEFVVDNPHVTTGVSAQNVAWAFREAYRATGGPLTWISHMLDVQVFGLEAGPHHLVSVTLHGLASLALFAALVSATGVVWRSALVAGLFGVHPLHVESVAWISERKDVLSALFWFVTLGAYVAYVRRPSLARYALVMVGFVLGLMSKPMIVTLPLTLLLWDYWPLARWRSTSVRFLLVEKAPLLVLSVVVMLPTLAAQGSIGAVADFERVDWPLRVTNASVAYVSYVRKAIWPTDLAVFYPYRDDISVMAAVASGAALLAGSVAAIRFSDRAPAVAMGWMWFVVTLIPVAGFVQVGGHAMADRFTYVPLVGLFIAVTWSGDALLRRWSGRVGVRAGAALVLMVVCVVAARAQTAHWRNGITLWQHAVEVTDRNGRAHANLGAALALRGDVAPAIEAYRAALAIEPDNPKTHNNLALAMVQQGQLAAAVSHYRDAIRLDPLYVNAHNNLANALAQTDNYVDALTHHRRAIELDPDNGLAHANLAITLEQMNRLDEAVVAMQEALQLNPRNADWHYIMGLMLVQKNDISSAIERFSIVLAINPSHRDAERALRQLQPTR